jgi:dihydropteroate synthase
MLNVKVSPQTMNCRGQLLDIESPFIMGILNVTADSFYDGSRLQDEQALIAMADKHLAAGAKILDIGVMSTRPGAIEIPEQDEIKMLSAAIRSVLKAFPHSIISADTYRAQVAHAALQAGAHMINDIGGGLFDDGIMEVVGEFRAPYVIMHNRAKSKDMSQHTTYNDIMTDITRFFYHQAHQAAQHGIVDIILDPGIGFSKTRAQNFHILNRMQEWSSIDYPLLVGLSRKSFIYKTLNTGPAEALNGTTAMHMIALQGGARILRVHDVKEAAQCIQLFNEMSRHGRLTT